MKKMLLCVLVVALSAPGLTAQPVKTLKKVLELKMPKTADDDMPGTRGASVAWHPVQKKYYAVFAGNSGFPLAIFDMAGKRLSDTELAAGIDTRGIWYNPQKKTICGNAYDTYGWFSYNLDKKGMLSDVVVDLEGMNQPGAQCVGAYDAAGKKTLFLMGGMVFRYDESGVKFDSIPLHFGRTKAQGTLDDEDIYVTPESYNNTAIIYTGIPGREIGVLNAMERRIEFYNRLNGFMTTKLNLPVGAPVENSFNFAYTNGIYWLFDISSRTWKGFR